MPLQWQPVGPLPAATYWRRRALAVLVVAAVVAGAALLLVRAAGGEGTLAPVADPTAPPGGSAAATGDPTSPPDDTTALADVAVCPDDVLEVTATADSDRYAPGARATLTLGVSNTGTVPCRRALGQGAVELVVTSGEDRIWSSDDCAPGGDAGEVVLAPGASQSARATWPGTRSAPGCEPGQPAAQPGTYRVTARVGDLRVPGAVFRVEG